MEEKLLSDPHLQDIAELLKKKYTGPKDGFAWLKIQDKKTYSALEKSLQKPTDLALLVKAAKLVYQF